MTIADRQSAAPNSAFALREALNGMVLLGFNVRSLDGDGVPQAKAAFVGGPTITVTSTADSGAGSLRDALAQNQANGGSYIIFSPAIAGQTITLQSPLTVSNYANINGGTNNITVSGGNAVGDFVVAGGNDAINNLTIANGNSTGATGTAGTMSPTSSAINGGPGGDAAGGIFVQSGTLQLSGDKFVNDTATGGAGGQAGFTGSEAQTKGAGGTGGNAAGAVYVEPGATVNYASGLTATAVSGTGGMGGSGTPGGGTVGAAGSGTPVSNNSNVTSNTVVCYCTGTLIRTARGEVAVEHLFVGDLAVTAFGAHRPIRWIGWKKISCANALDPEKVWPVCVHAGAFADNMPKRDLYLSPGHAIVPPGEAVLIPIGHLVNGTNITRDPRESVTYWHVELDQHDLLLAEGLAAESFIDIGVGDREWFENGHSVEEPRLSTYADMCMPYFVEWDRVTATCELLKQRAADAETMVLQS